MFILPLLGCVTTKRKGEETSNFKRTYHSFTNRYNYWFNADELYRLSVIKLESEYKDNYNQILEIYPYAAADYKSVKTDMDNVIIKAAKGIVKHRPGRWVDDNYLLIGQAQFIKEGCRQKESRCQKEKRGRKKKKTGHKRQSSFNNFSLKNCPASTVRPPKAGKK